MERGKNTVVLESLGSWVQNTSKVLDQDHFIYLFTHPGADCNSAPVTISPDGPVMAAGHDASTTYALIPLSASRIVSLGSLSRSVFQKIWKTGDVADPVYPHNLIKFD